MLGCSNSDNDSSISSISALNEAEINASQQVSGKKIN